VKKFIVPHDVVRVSAKKGMRTDNTAASAAVKAALDVHEMQGCAVPMLLLTLCAAGCNMSQLCTLSCPD
jgi:hypothetical protein